MIDAALLADRITKLRLQTISENARPRREETRPFKPLVSAKQVDDFRIKLLKERRDQGLDKVYNLPDMSLKDDFLTEVNPENLKPVMTDDEFRINREEIDRLAEQRERLGQQIHETYSYGSQDLIQAIPEHIHYLSELLNKIRTYDQTVGEIYNENVEYFIQLINEYLDHLRDEFNWTPQKTKAQLISDINLIIRGLNNYKEDYNQTFNLNNSVDAITETINQLVEKERESIDNEQHNNDVIRFTDNMNKIRLGVYSNLFNRLNRTNIQKNPGETDEDFLNRLKQLGETNYNDEQIELYTELDTLDTLKRNLKQIFNDDSLLLNIVKSLSNDQRYNLNKEFNLIKSLFVRRYGLNNQLLSLNEIVDYLTNGYKADMGIDSNIPMTSEIDTSKTGPLTKKKVTPNIMREDLGLQFKKFSKGEKKNIDGYLLIVHQLKDYIYLQIRKGTKYINFAVGPPNQIYASINRGLRGSFNRVGFDDSDEYNFTSLLQTLDINNDHIVRSLFGPSVRFENSKQNERIFYSFLTSPEGCNLKPYRPIQRGSDEYNLNLMTFETTTGLGISNKYNIPKEPVKYGRVYINLDKLYYKNILSIRNSDLKHVQSFKNANVSDDFVNYILKLLFKEQVSESDYKKLKSNEALLLDELNYLAGFGKEKSISKTQIIDDLEKELNLLVGSIEAGNTNRILLDEIRSVLMKLASFDAISLESAKKYYKDIKSQF